MKEIYVYGDHFSTPFDKFLRSVLGMRYMALAGEEWPFGEIVAYGYTKTGAYRKAVRKLHRPDKMPKRRVVAHWTECGERTR